MTIYAIIVVYIKGFGEQYNEKIITERIFRRCCKITL